MKRFTCVARVISNVYEENNEWVTLLKRPQDSFSLSHSPSIALISKAVFLNIFSLLLLLFWWNAFSRALQTSSIDCVLFSVTSNFTDESQFLLFLPLSWSNVLEEKRSGNTRQKQGDKHGWQTSVCLFRPRAELAWEPLVERLNTSVEAEETNSFVRSSHDDEICLHRARVAFICCLSPHAREHNDDVDTQSWHIGLLVIIGKNFVSTVETISAFSSMPSHGQKHGKSMSRRRIHGMCSLRRDLLSSTHHRTSEWIETTARSTRSSTLVVGDERLVCSFFLLGSQWSFFETDRNASDRHTRRTSRESRPLETTHVQTYRTNSSEALR